MLLWSICPSSAVETAFVVDAWRECSQVSVDAEYFLDGNIASSTRDDGSGRDGKRSSKIVFWFVCLFQASLLFFWPYAIIPLLHVWGLHKYCCAILSFSLLIFWLPNFAYYGNGGRMNSGCFEYPFIDGRGAVSPSLPPNHVCQEFWLEWLVCPWALA